MTHSRRYVMAFHKTHAELSRFVREPEPTKPAKPATPNPATLDRIVVAGSFFCGVGIGAAAVIAIGLSVGVLL